MLAGGRRARRARPPRAPRRPPAQRDLVVHVAVPLLLAALVGGDRARADLPRGLRHRPGPERRRGPRRRHRRVPPARAARPPTRPELALDRVPLLWRSKLPIYYALAAVARARRARTRSTAFSAADGDRCVGARRARLRAVRRARARGDRRSSGWRSLFCVGLDRMVLHGALRPVLQPDVGAVRAALRCCCSAGSRCASPSAGRSRSRRCSLALAAFTLPAAAAVPGACSSAVIAWRRRARAARAAAAAAAAGRGSALAVPRDRRSSLVLVRGVVEKIVPAIDAAAARRRHGGLVGPGAALHPVLELPRR